MIVRKVVKAEKHIATELLLECGHTVVCTGDSTSSVVSVPCEKCAVILERLQRMRSDGGGWFFARKVGGSLKAMRLLEDDGLVERSGGFRSGVIWRAKEGKA